MSDIRPILVDNLSNQASPIVAAWHAGSHVERRSHPPVTHSYATLAFFTEGQSRLEQNGEWQLTAGDVMLIPAGAPHRFIDERRPSYWGLAFCVPCFAANGAETLLEPFEKVRDGAAAVVQVPTARQAFLEQLFRELAQSGRARDRATLAAVQQSFLTLILNEVSSAAAPLSSAQAKPSVVTASLRFIERNCLRPLTLRDVANAVGRSPAYVTNALSRATGRSAVEWIVSARMAEARRLLLSSDEMVDVIAERVGYADSTHFIRMFRREHGATPATWRLTASRAPA
ncbi:MAG TPA: AraC family transcriptional regulator [Polyangiales bacterium]|nr:AraC family transcriptional regulator [Polyangiales bacterium]